MATQTKANSNSRKRRNSHRLTAVLCSLTTVCMFGLICQTSLAQSGTSSAELKKAYEIVNEKWRVIPLRPGATSKQIKEHRSTYKTQTRAISTSEQAADQVLENNGSLASVTPFFEGYVFPTMAVKDELVVSKLGAARAEFLKDFLNNKVKGGARSGLITLTINNMEKIYKNDSAHPASRLSAVYLIGMLDDVPAVRLDGQVPVPSKSAFAKLGQILLSNDPEIKDYLKVAAIAGIERHVEIDRAVGGQIPNQQKQALTAQFKTMLDNKATDDLSYWMKRRSMQILGLMGEASSADTAIATLKSDAGQWLKLDAVEALSRLPSSSLGAEKSLEASVAITDFVEKAIEQESKEIKAAVAKLIKDGILFQDIDLLANPVDYQKDAAAETGASAGGGGGDRGGPGLGGGMGGGMGGPGLGGGMGGGLGGGMGGGLGGGPGMGGGRDGITGAGMEKPQIELPGYQLHIIRRRIKSLAYLSSITLGGDDGKRGLTQNLGENEKLIVTEIYGELQDLLANSSKGITDLDKPEKELEPGEEPPGTATDELTELCQATSKRLKSQLSKLRGEPEPKEDPVAPATNPLADSDPAKEGAKDGATSAPGKDDGKGKAVDPDNAGF
ncbi:MAG: hypothetical protein P8J27_03035 [Mariniblastus sp.]|nr:hypothetical protein [Mariniblastus sp.]